MKEVHRRINKKVRQLCREINNRAGNREKLQSLSAQLQEVLQEQACETRVVNVTAPYEDNPFDKIMVA